MKTMGLCLFRYEKKIANKFFYFKIVLYFCRKLVIDFLD